jgi:hypothetical protein
MSFTVNGVCDVNEGFSGSGPNTFASNTSALTAGRYLLLITRTADGTPTPRTMSSISVGGQAAVYTGLSLVDGGYTWRFYEIEAIAVGGAQSIQFTVGGSGSMECGVWGLEIVPDTGSIALGAFVGSVSTGNESLNTTQANAMVLACARAPYEDPTCDDLGGGTIVTPAMANCFNYNAVGYTLDAGVVGAKAISFTSNNMIMALEITKDAGGGDPGVIFAPMPYRRVNRIFE